MTIAGKIGRRAAPAALAFLLVASLAGCGGGEAEPLNILLITIDTTRADYLGCYGGDVATPHIDRLAREGVQFLHCVAPSQCTNPAHATILTGLSLARHNVYDNTTPLTGAALTLSEVFQERGYTTLGAVSARHLNAKHSAFDQGFDIWLDCTAGKEHTAGERNELFLPELSALADSTFFAWVHYYDPHITYRPPPPFDTMYPVTDEHDPIQARRLNNKNAPPEEMADPDSLIAQYKGEISYLDAELGRLLETLDGMGVADRTLVILVADHGESMTEKHIFFKHGGLFNQTLHVPFVMRHPRLLPADLRIESLVTSADIFPTVLALAGLDSPVADLTGTDLSPLLDRPERQVHEQVVSEAWDGVIRAIHTPDGHKFLKPNPEDWTTPGPMLFRNWEDYWEENDLLGSEAGVAARLEEALDAWIENDKARALPAVEGHVVDEETREALKALGYVN